MTLRCFLSLQSSFGISVSRSLWCDTRGCVALQGAGINRNDLAKLRENGFMTVSPCACAQLVCALVLSPVQMVSMRACLRGSCRL